MNSNNHDSPNSRRNFLKTATATTLSFAGANIITQLTDSVASATQSTQKNNYISVTHKKINR